MEIVLMNDNAIIPTRASRESAGLDLYSSIDIDIEVGLIKKVNIGICMSLPENSYGSIRDKSSLASKDIYSICSYLINICCKGYFKLSQDEYLEIKKIMDNNTDIIESRLAPMDDYFDSSYHKKKVICIFPQNR